MEKLNNNFLSNEDIQKLFECDTVTAYRIMKALSKEMKAKGFFTYRGKIPKKYLFEVYGLPEGAKLEELKLLDRNAVMKLFEVGTTKAGEIIHRVQEAKKGYKKVKGKVFNLHLYEVFSLYLETN